MEINEQLELAKLLAGISVKDVGVAVADIRCVATAAKHCRLSLSTAAVVFPRSMGTMGVQVVMGVQAVESGEFPGVSVVREAEIPSPIGQTPQGSQC